MFTSDLKQAPSGFFWCLDPTPTHNLGCLGQLSVFNMQVHEYNFIIYAVKHWQTFKFKRQCCGYYIEWDSQIQRLLSCKTSTESCNRQEILYELLYITVTALFCPHWSVVVSLNHHSSFFYHHLSYLISTHNRVKRWQCYTKCTLLQ